MAGTKRSIARRATPALALGMFAALLLAVPALAGRTWCRSDPVVLLDGAPLQVEILVPAEYVSAVDGSVEVTIATPAGVERETIFTDAGFNGLGEVVVYQDSDAEVAADSSFPVQVTVVVPVDRSQLRRLGLSPRVPVQVIVTANGALTYSAAGTPSVDDGETTVVEGDNGRARVTITVAP
jgi:hypothetical protein